MVRSQSFKELLEIKKKLFLETVIMICKNRRLPIPHISFEGCEFESGDQLAHYHPELNTICCNERQLIMQDFDDIKTTAAHEVSHIRFQNHDPDFQEEEMRSSLAGWRPPGRIIHIEETKDEKKRKYKKLKEDKICCNYHLCRKKRELTKCSYCYKYYCSDHTKPYKPKIGVTESEDILVGHPCLAYIRHLNQKEEKAKIKYSKALEIILKKEKSRINIPMTDLEEDEELERTDKEIKPIIGKHRLSEDHNHPNFVREEVYKNPVYTPVTEKIIPKIQYYLFKTKSFWIRYKSKILFLLLILFLGFYFKEDLSLFFPEKDSLSNLESSTIIGRESLLISTNTSCINLKLKDRPNKCNQVCSSEGGNFISDKCSGNDEVYCKCDIIIYDKILPVKKPEQNFKSKTKKAYERLKLELSRVPENIRNLLEDVEVKLYSLSEKKSVEKVTSTQNSKNSFGDIFKVEPERKDECMEAFNYLNGLRSENGRRALKWDDRLYNLAVFRAKDMFDRNYFDHITPEGNCAKDFQSDFGISSNEFLAENAGGMSYYSKGDVAGNCKETVDGWMTSRGHRYNFLYDEHVSGAIGCYNEICLFYGSHSNPYGLGAGPCTTGEEGLAYWETAGKQKGEV